MDRHAREGLDRPRGRSRSPTPGRRSSPRSWTSRSTRRTSRPRRGRRRTSRSRSCPRTASRRSRARPTSSRPCRRRPGASSCASSRSRSCFPYYKDALAVDVQSGSLDFASHFAFGADRKFRLTGGAASIDDLRLALPRRQGAAVARPEPRGERASTWTSRRARSSIGERARRAARRCASRARTDGTLEAARLMKTTRDDGHGRRSTRTWTLAVKRLALERVALDVEDRVPRSGGQARGTRRVARGRPTTRTRAARSPR